MVKIYKNGIYLLILNSGLSFMTCVGQLEASKASLCGLQCLNSNSLQNREEYLDKGQRGYVFHHYLFEL